MRLIRTRNWIERSCQMRASSGIVSSGTRTAWRMSSVVNGFQPAPGTARGCRSTWLRFAFPKLVQGRPLVHLSRGALDKQANPGEVPSLKTQFGPPRALQRIGRRHIGTTSGICFPSTCGAGSRAPGPKRRPSECAWFCSCAIRNVSRPPYLSSEPSVKKECEESSPKDYVAPNLPRMILL